jgi:hypothetical protein
VRLLTSSVRQGGTLLASASDRGAGVDPGSVFAQVDGGPLQAARFRNGRIRIPVRFSPGRHRLTQHVSDYQESKNMENAARILPNTRVLTASFTVR